MASFRIQSIWNDPLYRFILKGLVLFILWYVLYDLWLHPSGLIDTVVIRNLEASSLWVLELLGYTTLAESPIETIRTVGIDGTHGLWIGDPCNGLTLFALFAGFVIAYPGSWKKKFWFIPLGLIAIHLINILRIVSLSVIIYYFPDPDVLDFNHNYTFTILVYGFVFFLWYLWAVKLSGVNQMQKQEESKP